MDRNDRNIRFFGSDGQHKLKNSTIVVAGVGGIGNHIVQQLAYLGVGEIILIDNETLDPTNLNRYVLTYHSDIELNPIKVDAAERTIKLINPEIKVTKIYNTAASNEAFRAIKNADCVFGCFDKDGIRFIINELCIAYSIPYIDIASDIYNQINLEYGGRICCVWDENACLSCLDVLNKDDIQKELGDPDFKNRIDEIYGVSHDDLDETGPSVVSINGVVASIAITEFVVGITSIRKPYYMQTYSGHMGIVTKRSEDNQGKCGEIYKISNLMVGSPILPVQLFMLTSCDC